MSALVWSLAPSVCVVGQATNNGGELGFSHLFEGGMMSALVWRLAPSVYICVVEYKQYKDNDDYTFIETIILLTYGRKEKPALCTEIFASKFF